MAEQPPYHVVIVGGGAGGLPLAASLGERYRRDCARRGDARRRARHARVEAVAPRSGRGSHGRRRARRRLSRARVPPALQVSAGQR